MVRTRIVYTKEQLIHLRDSPLITKPESLPSIDQWLDTPQENNQRKPRTQNGRPDESGPMGNFGSQRPTLLNTRQNRTSNGEDIVLGPPKTAFASARNIRKSGEDVGSAAQTPGDEDFSLEAMSARTRQPLDDDGGRKRGFGADKDKEGWTTARGGRNFENRGPTSDKERIFGRNTRDRNDKATPGEEDSGKRNGFGQRTEQRWTRDGDDKKPQRMSGREGGWRDREKRNDRESFRDQPQEKKPEWMEETFVDNEPQARSAADFEKWKAKMKGQKYEAPEEKVKIPLPEKSPGIAKATAPLLSDAMFGTWGDSKKADVVAQQEPAQAKAAGNKKSSRFASMFAPKEEARQPEPDLPALLAQHSQSMLPTEDQQGFQNILMKLRGTNMGSSQESITPRPTSGPPPGFSPGPQEARPNQGPSPIPLLQAMLAAKSEGRPNSRAGSNLDATPSPSLGPPSSGEQQQHHQQPPPQHRRQESGSQPPRNLTPEAQSIQNLLAAQRPRQQGGLSKDSEFLLNLINAKSASRPSQQQPQEHDPNFQLFLDQPPRTHTQGAPRQQPPGLGHGPQEPMFSPHHNTDQPDRRQASTQPPPGFFDGPHMPQGQLPQQRRPQNGPPGFGPPPGDFFNPEDPRHHQDRGPGPNAPPGFPPHLRGPPGMPNLFHGGPPGGPNGPPPPHFLQQRGPPGLSQPPGHGHPQPPPEHFSTNGPGGPGGPGIAPPPGFAAGPNYVPGAPPGFGPPPGQRGVPGSNMAGLGGMGFGPGPGPQGMKSPVEQGQGLRSPIEGFGGFGRGR
ncbi:hypothetical protein BDZ85DRAFT_315565 [Elsinoe ampelina]|uniref:Uncharacterized protein n=1 Tax=Elsinoe ampelina TaxID=302913 RepID=A0A6A6GQT5_9PEZI|nr:hypothetical protein BDZ85DRAFT_315565 [Elsinoe ampelina]